MIISKELDTNKLLPSGLHPVRIVVAHNSRRYIVETGVATSENMWDKERGLIKSSNPNSKFENEVIESQWRRVAGKIQSFIDYHLDSGLAEIFKTDINATSVWTPTLIAVTDMKIESLRNINTRRGYVTFRNFLSRNFEHKCALENIDQNFANRFFGIIEREYPLNVATRHLLISRLKSICNFAFRLHLMQSPDIQYPNYKYRPLKRSLSEASVKFIFDTYSRVSKKDSKFKSAGTFSLGLFVLDIAFQGLAPVDLASLKINQIRFVNIPNENCDAVDSAGNHTDYIKGIRIQTMRKKTGEPVTIIAADEFVGDFVRCLMKDKEKDDYLIPCFDKDEHYSEKKRQNRLSNYFHKRTLHLRRELQRSPGKGRGEDFSDITFYYARHAFCNIADGLDLPRHQIQTLVGHKRNVLERSYLRDLSEWEQVMISYKIFKKFI